MSIPFCRLTCAVALLLAVERGAAETVPARLSLAEAVQSALSRQPALALRREALLQREAYLLQTAGEFDPTLSALFAASRARTPGVNREALNFQSYLRNAGIDPPALTETLDPFAATNEVRIDDFNYRINFTRKLRNGIVVGPVASVNVNEGLSPPTAPLATGTLGFMVQVPLLRGLGTASSGAREAAARGEVEVARLLYRHELAQQAVRTAVAYWGSRAAAETAQLRLDLAARAAALLESTRPLIQASILPPTVLAQAEANALEKESLRLEANLAAAHARVELARALGLAPADFASPPEAVEPFPAVAAAAGTVPDRLVAWIESALAARADHQAARRSRDPAALLARKAQSDLRPRLDVGLQAGYAGLSGGRYPLDALRERRTSGNAAVTVQLDWPLRNSLQQGLLREARSREREAEARLAALAADIAADVAAAVRESALRAELALAAERTVAAADAAVRGEQARLGLGESSLPDVIALENALGEARLQQVNAHAGYAIAIVRLRFATGTLFSDLGADGSFTLARLTLLPASP
jgi:outer membrane protein TolC